MAVGVDQPLITLEAFLRRRETKPYTELIDGIPFRKPVGTIAQSRAQLNTLRLVLEQLNGFSFHVDELFS